MRSEFKLKLSAPNGGTLEYSGESLWVPPGILYTRYTSSGGELRNIVRVGDRAWIHDRIVGWVTAEEAGLRGPGPGIFDPYQALAYLDEFSEYPRSPDAETVRITLVGSEARVAVWRLFPWGGNYDLENGDFRLTLTFASKPRPEGLTYRALLAPPGDKANALTMDGQIDFLPSRGEKSLEFKDDRGLSIPIPQEIRNAIETLLRQKSPPRPENLWEIRFLAAAQPKGPIRGMVLVAIENTEEGLGAIREAHSHHVGDRIGWWEDPPGSGKIDSKHEVFQWGKRVLVDLDTGMELLSVEPKTILVESEGCKPILASEAGPARCQYAIEKRPCEVTEVVYRDAKGEKKATVVDPQVAERARNFFCSKHTPEILTRREPKGLGEALLLLKEADGLWGTDAEAAISIYKRLLLEFSEAVTALQARNKVERRAQQSDQ